MCVLLVQRWNNDWFAQLNGISVTSGIFRFAFCYRTTKCVWNVSHCTVCVEWDSMEYCWYTVQCTVWRHCHILSVLFRRIVLQCFCSYERLLDNAICAMVGVSSIAFCRAMLFEAHSDYRLLVREYTVWLWQIPAIFCINQRKYLSKRKAPLYKKKRNHGLLSIQSYIELSLKVHR